MNRRAFGIITAVALALVGTVALVAYVGNAENRALAGEQLANVYVVSTEVPAGTPGEDLAQYVTLEQVPVKVRAQGAIDDLGVATGKVAGVDLLVGEQLVDSRIVSRSEYTDREAGVRVPDDMVEVTVKLDPQRAVGGLIQPGQTVAVFASFEPFQLTTPVVKVNGQEVAVPQSVAAEVEGSTPNTTKLMLDKVLVTAVQQGAATSGSGLGGSAQATQVNRLDTAPSESLLVTLAVRPYDADRLVFTAEFGRVWLAAQRDTVPATSYPATNRGSVYTDQVPGK